MQIKISKLKELGEKILIKHGFSEKDAKLVFAEYLDGELRGRPCHGISTFPGVINKLEKVEGEVEVLKDEDTTLYLDAKGNMGQVVMDKYLPQLIEKAKSKNIAMLGIKNMQTFLMPGTYARVLAENDLIGIISNYGGTPRIVAYGGLTPLFGANTLAIGIPGKNSPIVSDYATSITNMGKVRLAQKMGGEIAADAYLDEKGNLTTNPEEVFSLLPFGKHKGYALALAAEVLSKTMYGIEEKGKRGFFFMAINPATFQDIDKFKEGVSELVNKVKNSKKAEGIKEIFVPGEHSERIKQENLQNGYLEIDDQLIEEIRNLQYFSIPIPLIF